MAPASRRVLGVSGCGRAPAVASMAGCLASRRRAPRPFLWPGKDPASVGGSWRRPSRPALCASPGNGAGLQPGEREGPSTDPAVIYSRLQRLALPYWTNSAEARWKLAGVVVLTLATTGVSVVFNFIGRDFFNALEEKDTVAFTEQLIKYLGAFVVGIPVFVFRGYYRSKLSLEWREWMTEQFLYDYMAKRTFYKVQAASMMDNPDQRISIDIKVFTESTLVFALTLLNALVDLVSFSGILFSIYPPLFIALLVYSVGGTAVSIGLGQSLIGLNFRQEAREADLRFGLVRIRENAESIAFYSGEKNEVELVLQRLFNAVNNFQDLLVSSRNLDFFTSFYRFVIQLLPAAVVAPLFFQGKIEFGVINQSQSAFNHILGDVSLVVYQVYGIARWPQKRAVDAQGKRVTMRQQGAAKTLVFQT
ncbi:unnamed protein product [Ostreobium quekettii]|uniref:ABC transmembrane type-1 domain-containing protein n=1 Tax=Ostreobium quekettii TaxID=121088 RepID=A0A8S1IZ12_9CHLO|nr:unnamed protein product [Ostreobium quekettii]